MSAGPVVRLIDFGPRGLGGYGRVRNDRLSRGFRLLQAIEPAETCRAVKFARDEQALIGGPIMPDGRMRRGTIWRLIHARGLREMRRRGMHPAETFTHRLALVQREEKMLGPGFLIEGAAAAMTNQPSSFPNSPLPSSPLSKASPISREHSEAVVALADVAQRPTPSSARRAMKEISESISEKQRVMSSLAPIAARARA